jgi:hypothetical protein
MIERIEDIRHHRLPRYYELLNRYTQSLWHWCVFVNNSLLVTKPRQSPQNPAAEQADRPNLPMLLCHGGEHIHSRNALAIAAAAREGKNYLRLWTDKNILRPFTKFTKCSRRFPWQEIWLHYYCKRGWRRRGWFGSESWGYILVCMTWCSLGSRLTNDEV